MVTRTSKTIFSLLLRYMKVVSLLLLLRYMEVEWYVYKEQNARI